MESKSLVQKRFKPNVVYELLIHGVYRYIGCHCYNKDFLLRNIIISESGNYLAEARDNQLITRREYLDSVELINTWEFDTKEEAQEFEAKKIQERKEEYGSLCKNKSLGNKYGSRGLHFSGRKGWHHSEENKRKLSEARKGVPAPWNSYPRSEETKRKISETLKGHTASNKGKHVFTNGIINVYSLNCPEGFWTGRKSTN